MKNVKINQFAPIYLSGYCNMPECGECAHYTSSSVCGTIFQDVRPFT